MERIARYLTAFTICCLASASSAAPSAQSCAMMEKAYGGLIASSNEWMQTLKDTSLTPPPAGDAEALASALARAEAAKAGLLASGSQFSLAVRDLQVLFAKCARP